VLQTTAGKMIFGRHIDLAAGAQGGQQSSSSVNAGAGSGGQGNGERTSSERADRGERADREESYRKTRPMPQAQQT
jgi:hypothetical protein